jgi:hypothetical protein
MQLPCPRSPQSGYESLFFTKLFYSHNLTNGGGKRKRRQHPLIVNDARSEQMLKRTQLFFGLFGGANCSPSPERGDLQSSMVRIIVSTDGGVS